jgi:hypothetical protein
MVCLLAACSSADGGANEASVIETDGGADATPSDAAKGDTHAPPPDAADEGAHAPGCYSTSGAPGDCMIASACSAIADHTPASGNCPGAEIECCIKTPNVADNPPIPAGYKLLDQAQVTTEMTNWAVSILHDPVTYPMFSTATRTFGSLTVLARVEWHPPDFQNSVIHRGVTLYEPI